MVIFKCFSEESRLAVPSTCVEIMPAKKICRVRSAKNPTKKETVSQDLWLKWFFKQLTPGPMIARSTCFSKFLEDIRKLWRKRNSCSLKHECILNVCSVLYIKYYRDIIQIPYRKLSQRKDFMSWLLIESYEKKKKYGLLTAPAYSGHCFQRWNRWSAHARWNHNRKPKI